MMSAYDDGSEGQLEGMIVKRPDKGSRVASIISIFFVQGLAV